MCVLELCWPLRGSLCNSPMLLRAEKRGLASFVVSLKSYGQKGLTDEWGYCRRHVHIIKDWPY